MPLYATLSQYAKFDSFANFTHFTNYTDSLDSIDNLNGLAYLLDYLLTYSSPCTSNAPILYKQVTLITLGGSHNLNVMWQAGLAYLLDYLLTYSSPCTSNTPILYKQVTLIALCGSHNLDVMWLAGVAYLFSGPHNFIGLAYLLDCLLTDPSPCTSNAAILNKQVTLIALSGSHDLNVMWLAGVAYLLDYLLTYPSPCTSNAPILNKQVTLIALGGSHNLNVLQKCLVTRTVLNPKSNVIIIRLELPAVMCK